MIRKFLVLCVGVFVAWGTREYVALPLRVQSQSMRPTLEAGDWVVVLRAPLSHVTRGDIVVFRLSGVVSSGAAGEEFVVKRVVAVPGDTVDFDGSKVAVNSQLMGSESSPAPATQEGAQLEASTPPWTKRLKTGSIRRVVSKGTFFVLGDNFQHSADSRAYGPISEQLVLGRVVFTQWRARWMSKGQ